MTPQLQQAIKLLQLSNLELTAICRAGARAQSAAGTRRKRAGGRRRARSAGSRRGSEARNARQRAGARRFLQRRRYGRRARRRLSPKTRRRRRPASTPRFPTGRRCARRRAATATRTRWSARSRRRHRSRIICSSSLRSPRLIAREAADRGGPDRFDRRSGLSARRSRRNGGAPRHDAGMKSAKFCRLSRVSSRRALRARDLAECLALQLREQGRFDPAMEALLAHLDLVARRDIAGLCVHLRRRCRRRRRHDRRNPRADAQAGSRLRLASRCSPSCPTCSCAKARTAAGTSN